MTSTLRTLKFAAAAVLLAVLVYSAVLPMISAQDSGDNGDAGSNGGRTHGTGDGDGTGDPCQDHAPGVGGCPSEDEATPTPTPAGPAPTATPTPRPTATPTPTSGSLSNPPAPSGFSANASKTDCSVVLFWNYRRGIEEYQIQYRGPGGSWKSKYVSGARSAKQQRDVDEGRQPRATMTVISGLMEGTAYDFRIAAEGDGIEYADDYGPWATDTATTGTGCGTPPTPTPTPTPTSTPLPTPTPTPTPRPCPGCLPPTSTPTPTPTPTSTPTPTPTRPLERAPDPTGFEVAASTQSDTIFVATWDAHDGIKEYQLQHMEDGGVWISEPRIPGNALRPPDELINRELTATVHLECGIYYGFRLRAWGDRARYNEQSSGWGYYSEVNNCVDPPPSPEPSPTPAPPRPGVTVDLRTTTPIESSNMQNNIDGSCVGENDHWSKVRYKMFTETIDGTEVRTFETTVVDWRSRSPRGWARTDIGEVDAISVHTSTYQAETVYLRSDGTIADSDTSSAYSDGSGPDCRLRRRPAHTQGGRLGRRNADRRQRITFELIVVLPGDGDGSVFAEALEAISLAMHGSLTVPHVGETAIHYLVSR